MTKVHGYVRVSTASQADSGLGIEAQQASIARWTSSRGLQVSDWHIDVVSGGDHPATRDALSETLYLLKHEGTEGALVVARGDRIARRVADLIWLRDRAIAQGWELVAADGSIDTTTPHGRLVTTVMGAAAELERDLISSRTSEALAAAKARGSRLGPPVLTSPALRMRIMEEREMHGRRYADIARDLNSDRLTTATGKQWTGTAVSKVVKSVLLDREAEMRARVARVAAKVSS